MSREQAVERAVRKGERLVNLEVLAQYVGGNPALQRRISQRFLESARQTVFQMQQAERLGDYEKIGILAHRIKPSAMAMGATRMSNLAAQLEQAAYTKCSNTIREQLRYLAPMLVQLEWEIAALT